MGRLSQLSGQPNKESTAKEKRCKKPLNQSGPVDDSLILGKVISKNVFAINITKEQRMT